MSVYAVDKLMAEARKLAAEYRRVTGKTLPVSSEIAISDAIRLLDLQPAENNSDGWDVVRHTNGKNARLQVKARIVFDQTKGAHPLGQLNLDRSWDGVLLVLMNDEYEAQEIYEADRDVIVQTIAGKEKKKRGSMSVAQFKKIGRRVWPAAGASANGPED